MSLSACAPVTLGRQIPDQVTRSELSVGGMAILPTLTNSATSAQTTVQEKLAFEAKLESKLNDLVPGVKIASTGQVTQDLVANDQLSQYFSSMTAAYERGIYDSKMLRSIADRRGVRYLVIPWIYSIEPTTSYSYGVPIYRSLLVSTQIMIFDVNADKTVLSVSHAGQDHGALRGPLQDPPTVGDAVRSALDFIFDQLRKTLK